MWGCTSLVLVAACGSSSPERVDGGDLHVVISGSGSGPCGNSDPARGPVWHFEFVDYASHISTIEIYMRNLIAGETGLYVSGLQFANGIAVVWPPATANILPNDGVVKGIASTFSKTPGVVPEPVCKWDAIGPFWPDAPP